MAIAIRTDINPQSKRPRWGGMAFLKGIHSIFYDSGNKKKLEQIDQHQGRKTAGKPQQIALEVGL